MADRPLRIAQITDTHLSDRHGFFVDNYMRAVADINAWQPDLVVHTGDLSINGADRLRDLEYSKEMLAAIGAPVLVVPGNHDVGEEPGFMQLDQPTTDARMAKYHNVFGPDRWSRSAGGWRLIGMNAQLLGTGLAHEEKQWRWLESELAEATQPVAIFTHKPLFFPRDVDQQKPASIFLPAGVRARLFSLLSRHHVRFVASGHLHKYLDISVGGVRWLWAPATAYRSGLRIGVGQPLLGYLQIEIFGDGCFEARLRQPDGMVAQKLKPLKNGEKFLKDAPPFAPPEKFSIPEDFGNA